MPVADSIVVRYFEGDEVDEPVVEAVARLMEHADSQRRLHVRTNADTAEDAARARRFGAQGIGLCRTEHMFLGERRQLVENLIVAEDEAGPGGGAWPSSCRSSARTSSRSSRRWTACRSRSGSSTRRCTSSSPTSPSSRVSMAVADVRGHRKKRQRTLLAAVQRLHESNPMLGLRGVRLGIVIPGLFTMQARAILEAAAERIRERRPRRARRS